MLAADARSANFELAAYPVCMLELVPIVISVASGIVAVIAVVNATKSRKAAESADLRAREPLFEVSGESRDGQSDWQGSFELALIGPADLDRVTFELVTDEVRFENAEGADVAAFDHVRVGSLCRMSVNWEDGAVSATGGTITLRVQSSLGKDSWGPRQVRVTLPDSPRSRRLKSY